MIQRGATAVAIAALPFALAPLVLVGQSGEAHAGGPSYYRCSDFAGGMSVGTTSATIDAKEGDVITISGTTNDAGYSGPGGSGSIPIASMPYVLAITASNLGMWSVWALGASGSITVSCSNSPTTTGGNPTAGTTQNEANNFQTDRGNGIITNQPELICFMNGSCGTFGSANGFGGSGFSAHGPVSKTQNFKIRTSAASLLNEAERRRRLESEDGQDSYSTADLPQSFGRYYDIWAEVHGSVSENNGVDSDLFAAYIGGHIKLTEDLLLGLMAEIDRAGSSNPATGASINGTGFMFGPYLVAKLPDHELYFEGRALFGRSYNNISPIGTYTDRFQASRMLLRAKVSGDIRLDNDYTVRPEGYLTYFAERRDAYTDSNGTPIPGQTVALGELRVGPTIYKEIVTDDGTLLQPRVGVSGVVNFARQNAAIGTGGVRGRLDAGINIQTPEQWTLDVSAFYDGLFNSAYYSVGGQISLGKSF